MLADWLNILLLFHFLYSEYMLFVFTTPYYVSRNYWCICVRLVLFVDKIPEKADLPTFILSESSQKRWFLGFVTSHSSSWSYYAWCITTGLPTQNNVFKLDFVLDVNKTFNGWDSIALWLVTDLKALCMEQIADYRVRNNVSRENCSSRRHRTSPNHCSRQRWKTMDSCSISWRRLFISVLGFRSFSCSLQASVMGFFQSHGILDSNWPDFVSVITDGASLWHERREYSFGSWLYCLSTASVEARRALSTLVVTLSFECPFGSITDSFFD